ncbi:GNAT family N-acetyltransferase [Pararhizobium sp. IMCC21322]|uniref:GNAT family N-acetyltransferase n=1 Tax=Pararhizobium sp. IMCC21322 TaxID=3067903 RepID=UPI00274296BD|nr:GNAT family N-acetyltransferase [Pararhizobium sp. IMCC21322]
MDRSTIHIRAAEIGDAAVLSQVHRASWFNAYHGILNGTALRESIARRNKHWWLSAVEKLNAEPASIGGRMSGGGARLRQSRLLVLEFDGSVAGYANFGTGRRNYPPYAISRWGEIFELYLLPEYQGLGFGRMLFDRVRAELKDMEHGPLIVWALEANDQAIGFYTSLGGESFVRSHEMFGGTQAPTIGFRWI